MSLWHVVVSVTVEGCDICHSDRLWHLSLWKDVTSVTVPGCGICHCGRL